MNILLLQNIIECKYIDIYYNWKIWNKAFVASKNHLYSTNFYYINEFMRNWYYISKNFIKWNEEYYRIKKSSNNNQSYKFRTLLTIRLFKKLINKIFINTSYIYLSRIIFLVSY